MRAVGYSRPVVPPTRDRTLWGALVVFVVAVAARAAYLAVSEHPVFIPRLDEDDQRAPQGPVARRGDHRATIPDAAHRVASSGCRPDGR